MQQFAENDRVPGSGCGFHYRSQLLAWPQHPSYTAPKTRSFSGLPHNILVYPDSINIPNNLNKFRGEYQVQGYFRNKDFNPPLNLLCQKLFNSLRNKLFLITKKWSFSTPWNKHGQIVPQLSETFIYTIFWIYFVIINLLHDTYFEGLRGLMQEQKFNGFINHRSCDN